MRLCRPPATHPGRAMCHEWCGPCVALGRGPEHLLKILVNGGHSPVTPEGEKGSVTPSAVTELPSLAFSLFLFLMALFSQVAAIVSYFYLPWPSCFLLPLLVSFCRSLFPSAVHCFLLPLPLLFC